MTDAFSVFIKEHMRHRSWNLAELCRRSETTTPEMSRVLAGIRPPSLRLIVALARAFAMSSSRSTDAGLTGFDAWAGKLLRLAAQNKGYKTAD